MVMRTMFGAGGEELEERNDGDDRDEVDEMMTMMIETRLMRRG